MIRRQSIKFQINPMKDVRGVAGTRSDRWKDRRKDRLNDGWMDRRTHGWMGFISIVPVLPTSGDKYIGKDERRH